MPKPGRYDSFYLVAPWLKLSAELRKKLADGEPLVITRVAGPAICLFTGERKA